MKKKDKVYSKEDFTTIVKLTGKQPWLGEKANELEELLGCCKNDNHKSLIIELLERFKFVTFDEFDSYLKEMAKFIVYGSGFVEEKTQLVAIAVESEIDSSQWILQALKTKLVQYGWGSVSLISKLGNSIKGISAGKNQIILIDEFVGSGQTLSRQINYMLKNATHEIDLKCCIFAAMETALENLNKYDIDIFCPLILKSGIDAYHSGYKLISKIASMIELENILLPEINDFHIKNYSLGYNKAQALYSAEGCAGNTPNSVFPIFWWPKLEDGTSRKNLLKRYEKGLI